MHFQSSHFYGLLVLGLFSCILQLPETGEWNTVIHKFANVFSHRTQTSFWQLPAGLIKSFTCGERESSDQERARVKPPGSEHWTPRGCRYGLQVGSTQENMQLYLSYHTEDNGTFGPTEFNYCLSLWVYKGLAGFHIEMKEKIFCLHSQSCIECRAKPETPAEGSKNLSHLTSESFKTLSQISVTDIPHKMETNPQSCTFSQRAQQL